MECKTTSTRGSRAGYTLPEVLIAFAVGGVVLGAVAALSLYSARSFVTIGNYIDLDSQSRWTVNRMSREIREAVRVIACTGDRLTIQVESDVVIYLFQEEQKRLIRLAGGDTDVLLKGCDFARFDLYQRQATNAGYASYPAAAPANAKLVQVTWNCSRDILGESANTETLQSAKIVIRKQVK